MTPTTPHRRVIGLLVVAAVALTGCGGDGDDDRGADASTLTPATTGTMRTTAAAPATAASLVPTSTEPTPAAPEVAPMTSDPPLSTIGGSDTWLDEVSARCAKFGAALASIPAPLETVDGTVEFFAAIRAAVRENDDLKLTGVDLPPELGQSPTDITALATTAVEWLDEAIATASSGDIDAASTAFDRYLAHAIHVGAVLTVAGAECGGDPARPAGAALNVPLVGAWQVETGFDSVWVSEQHGTHVIRIDPASGETLASIDVGSRPIKLQPADARMFVRTEEAYVAIDPATNDVTGTLAKSDVGPAANRSWAVDGGLWICDGQRLHRHDPATLKPVALVELGIDCGQVYATGDLVVAWTYNEDDGESETSVAAFVDPSSDTVVATVDLPVDAGVPIVLDDAVFFPGFKGSRAAVVDRATWTVAATPEVGRQMGGSQSATDGESIYVVVDGTDVAVIDPTTFTITDTIAALDHDADVNSVAVGPGALWVVNDDAGYLQRFDLGR